MKCYLSLLNRDGAGLSREPLLGRYLKIVNECADLKLLRQRSTGKEADISQRCWCENASSLKIAVNILCVLQ